ncbi:MAG TPA: hypothetical protein VFD48_09120 [Pyrinomonadaceae bacterium]|nr:hypothetical protein [Pyrinomonadaceae bacterium]
MRSLSTCFAAIAIVFALQIESSCDWGRRGENDQVANVGVPNQVQSSNDDQLLKEIEQFASSEESPANSAWQSLQSRNRSTLIADLTRIMNAPEPNERNRLLVAFTFCKLHHDYAANREAVVAVMSQTGPYGEWAVSLARRLMLDGDKDLLVPLLKASEWSDGAMSTALAHAYSQALVTDPENFLRMLSLQSEPTRSKVFTLLKVNSFNAEDKRKVESSLKNVIRPPKLRRIAEQTLRALAH